MANLASSKKQARKNVARREINTARRTAVKTAIRKVMDALEKKDMKAAQTLMRDAEAQLSRAKNKKLLHPSSAKRRIGRLAHRVAVAGKK